MARAFGLGLATASFAIREWPIISCAARLEEKLVVIDKGCRVITLFPAEELPIANRY
jgi:hypothetical protein